MMHTALPRTSVHCLLCISLHGLHYSSNPIISFHVSFVTMLPAWLAVWWCSWRRAIRELHLQTCDELGVEPEVKREITQLLDNLQQLLIGICIMQVDGVGWRPHGVERVGMGACMHASMRTAQRHTNVRSECVLGGQGMQSRLWCSTRAQGERWSWVVNGGLELSLTLPVDPPPAAGIYCCCLYHTHPRT